MGPSLAYAKNIVITFAVNLVYQLPDILTYKKFFQRKIIICGKFTRVSELFFIMVWNNKIKYR